MHAELTPTWLVLLRQYALHASGGLAASRCCQVQLGQWRELCVRSRGLNGQRPGVRAAMIPACSVWHGYSVYG